MASPRSLPRFRLPRRISCFVEAAGCPNPCHHCCVGDERLPADFHLPFEYLLRLLRGLRPEKEEGPTISVHLYREPTCYPQYLDFLWAARSMGFRPAALEETQGWGLIRRPGLATAMRQYGIRSLLMACHGTESVHDHLVGRRGAYRELRQALALAASEGFRVVLSFFLSHGNARSLAPSMEDLQRAWRTSAGLRRRSKLRQVVLLPIRIGRATGRLPVTLETVRAADLTPRTTQALLTRYVVEKDLVSHLARGSRSCAFEVSGFDYLTLFVRRTGDTFMNCLPKTDEFRLGNVIERPLGEILANWASLRPEGLRLRFGGSSLASLARRHAPAVLSGNGRELTDICSLCLRLTSLQVYGRLPRAVVPDEPPVPCSAHRAAPPSRVLSGHSPPATGGSTQCSTGPSDEPGNGSQCSASEP